MLRRGSVLIAVAVLACVAALALTSSRPVGADRITLYFTATANGNLEPCGCPVNPSGGLPRRAAFVKRHTEPGSVAALLDGGEYIGPPTREGLLQTEYILRAMKAMGYTVLGVGPRDFVFGLDFLERAQRRFGFTFTSANLVNSESGDLIFPPYGLIEAGTGSILGVSFGGTKIGVISVMGQDEPPICEGRDLPVALLDPVNSVRRTASAIRSECSIVVVLAHTSQQQLEQMLAIPDVDVVIAARTLYPPLDFDNVGLKGHVAVGYAGYEARRIGLMHLERDDGKIISARGDLESLGETVPDDPMIAGIVVEYNRERAKLRPAERSEHGH